MFTLQDGREHLYQWDLDRYIIVEDNTICEVHFCNRTSDCSLVVEVKDGLAPIPNILLQEARPIRAYAYCDDKYTLTEEQFTVKSRTRPDDYVYTETDVITVRDMIDRADKTLEQTSEALANSEVALANATAATQTANDTIALAQEAVVDMDRLVADAAQSAYDANEAAEQAAAAVVNYYTKEDHATNYSDAKEVAYFDFTGSPYWEELPEEYNKILNRIHAGEQIVVYIKDTYNYAIADFIVSTTTITFRTHFTDLFSDGRTTIEEYVALLQDGVWLVKENSDKTYKFATEEYVNNAIANIPTGGGGSGECNIPLISNSTVDITNTPAGLYGIDCTQYTLSSVQCSEINAIVNFEWWVSNGMLLIRDHNVVAWGQDNADIMFYVINMDNYADQEVTLSPTGRMDASGWTAGAVSETKVQEMIDASLGVIENGSY